VNYAFGKAIEFDFEGKPLRVFDKAVGSGAAMLALSAHPLTANRLSHAINT
jgi:hypothetical protein